MKSQTAILTLLLAVLGSAFCPPVFGDEIPADAATNAAPREVTLDGPPSPGC